MAARPVTISAQDFHARAIAAERAGDPAGAQRIMDEGLGTHPADAGLHNSAGSLAMRAGDSEAAEARFAAALEREPGNVEFAINRAIALDGLGRSQEAADLLKMHEQAGASIPRYWSVRGASERSAKRVADAERSYDRCLTLEPGHSKALHGRARVALERGEADALARFDRALAVNPGDADLWLGKAQALEVAGNLEGARTIAQQLSDQAPAWLEGHKYLAQLRIAAGESDFASHYSDAAEKLPQDPNVASAHCEVLAGNDRFAEAADIAADAQGRFPDELHFRMLEAVHAGSGGEWDRADRIFTALEYDIPTRNLHEARHLLRSGDAGGAERLLSKVLAQEPWSIPAWALIGIAWRMTGDDRAYWLHEQDGLVQRCDLHGAEGLVDRSAAFLRSLHAGSAFPLGQSLRGGTQTRGMLFDRTEPVLAELREAILATLEDYRAALPPQDASHPLLRHRDRPLRLEGSWSVRLTAGGDYHAAHIHPQGIISSALYLVVPPDTQQPGGHGWLEVGRPARDLGLDLGPIRTIEPKPGTLALFPSTLYHGTRPFGEAERMTVAFDIVPASETSP